MQHILVLVLAFLSFLDLNAMEAPRITYGFTEQPIDVVIPSTDKDLITLELCIEGIKANGTNIRRVIVVSDRPLTHNAEWFDEKNYPFNKSDVALHLFKGNAKQAQQYLGVGGNRVGWYYQQLLKFYAPYIIEGLSPNVLILDSDTVFLRPVEFLNKSFGGLLNPGEEYHHPYFKHADLLTGGLVKRLSSKLSGISHHMLFQKSVLDDLFNHVELLHGQEFWKAFCMCVDKQEIPFSGASEYEIYFNFVLARTKEVKVRTLKWENITSLAQIPLYAAQGYHYVSCHSYHRED